MTAKILVGTCSWTDPSLIACGTFYPQGVCTAESRLRYYASQFPIVEVDSTYYAPPSERNSVLWAARTPPGFIFDVKAHALLTGHPAQVDLLPLWLREGLPASAAGKRSIYRDSLSAPDIDRLWELHRTALAPLAEAGKLGAVLFQFPPWFVRSRGNIAYLEEVAARLPGWRAAVEFRGGGWMSAHAAEHTLGVLQAAQLSYVSVDEPQDDETSTPPVAFATTELAVVRLHGRNAATWRAKTTAASERFKYLYSDAELLEWAPKIEELARTTRSVHVLFNNNYEDWGLRNARRMADLLGAHVSVDPALRLDLSTDIRQGENE